MQGGSVYSIQASAFVCRFLGVINEHIESFDLRALNNSKLFCFKTESAPQQSQNYYIPFLHFLHFDFFAFLFVFLVNDLGDSG